MTLEEAKQEAVRRWGPEAIAVHNFQLTYNCEVATGAINPYIWATGSTWEEAFKRADDEQLRVCGKRNSYGRL